MFKMVSERLSKLAETGVDNSGIKTVELHFNTPSHEDAMALRQRFYHPEGGMETVVGTDGHHLHWVKSRFSTELTEKAIESYLWSFSKVATEFGGTLENWRVVLEHNN